MEVQARDKTVFAICTLFLTLILILSAYIEKNNKSTINIALIIAASIANLIINISLIFGASMANLIINIGSIIGASMEYLISRMVNTIRLQKKKHKLENAEEEVNQQHKIRYKCPEMTKTIGEFTESQVIVIQGREKTGKTTVIRMLAGLLKPDTINGKTDVEMPELFNVSFSYKPQKINPVSRSTVRHLLQQRIPDAIIDHQFVSLVLQPLLIEHLMDEQVVNLSYGEWQRVELCLCLGKPADIYMIDEPGAYLNSELKLVAAKVIKNFVLHTKKTAFVAVAHYDYVMSFHLFDLVIFCNDAPIIVVASSPLPRLFDLSLKRIPMIRKLCSNDWWW